MSDPIIPPPALVLGCNTPHGIGVLSDWIEEQTGHAPDFTTPNPPTGTDDASLGTVDLGYIYESGAMFGDGAGSAYGREDGFSDGDFTGYGNGDGSGDGSGHPHWYGDGNGDGEGGGTDLQEEDFARNVEPAPWEDEPDNDDDAFAEYGDWDTCWHCHGEGGFHDCGEDCCPCADPELNETCPECDGTGRI